MNYNKTISKYNELDFNNLLASFSKQKIIVVTNIVYVLQK